MRSAKYVSIGLVVVLLVIVAAAVGTYYQAPPSSQDQSTAPAADDELGWRFPTAKFPLTGSDGQLAFSNIRDPGGIPKGLPVRLKIPVIGVDSAIEDALITPDGRMDVPLGSVNVAWFSLGPYPGKEGSAVIGGHFGIRDGVPFVFYNLNKLRVGDRVYVVDDRDKTLAFQIRTIKSFDRNADATTVFTSNDGLAHLNLITCEGVWNQIDDSYPQRLVIFTDAIQSEGDVTVTPILPSAAIPIPNPAPTPGPASASTESPYAWTQSIVAVVGASFATPADAMITVILLISILFIAGKIIRARRDINRNR